MNSTEHKRIIKEEALRLGFQFVGVSKAEFLEDEAPRLEQWLSGNKHGKMSYMERWFDKRLDPRLLVPGAKSVVSFLLNYFPKEKQEDTTAAISKYAYGRDYHYVIKEKLKSLSEFIRVNIGNVEGRAFVDSAPVLDRAWAARSGLGWIGKNANLIHPRAGSFFFIAELIIDLELEPDSAMTDYCGTCTRCIDACPTDAITAAHIVDGSKCISYLTIELRDDIPSVYKDKMKGWIFGCDICQDVCPWNRFSTSSTEKDFIPNEHLLKMKRKDWEEITEDVFNTIYKDSPLKRAGFSGMKKNLQLTLLPGGMPGQ